jgi:hypothetical protein
MLSISDSSETMQIYATEIFDRMSRTTSSTQKHTPSEDISQIEFPRAS